MIKTQEKTKTHYQVSHEFFCLNFILDIRFNQLLTRFPFNTHSTFLQLLNNSIKKHPSVFVSYQKILEHVLQYPFDFTTTMKLDPAKSLDILDVVATEIISYLEKLAFELVVVLLILKDDYQNFLQSI